MRIGSKIVACLWLIAALAWVCYGIFGIYVAIVHHIDLAAADLLLLLLPAVLVGIVAIAVLLGRIWGWWGLVALSSLCVIGTFVLVCGVFASGSNGGDNMGVMGAIVMAVLGGLSALISLLVLLKNSPISTTSAGNPKRS